MNINGWMTKPEPPVRTVPELLSDHARQPEFIIDTRSQSSRCGRTSFWLL